MGLRTFKKNKKNVDTPGTVWDIASTHGNKIHQKMRTKALLCAAALAAGAATSMAQSNVYSLNVVGYYNVPVPANQLVLVANQLNTTNNTIAGLIQGPPNAQFYKYNGG